MPAIKKNKNAQKWACPLTTIQFRIPVALKEAWIEKALLKKLTLTEFILERVEGQKIKEILKEFE